MGRSFECSSCPKRFQGSHDLRKHTRTHTDERPFVCDECQQAFRQAGTLKNHITAIHCKMREFFQCPECGKTFALKERLRLHQRTHTGEKPYACEFCGKRFARGGQRVQHLRVHDREKPHGCDMCSARFTCSQNLRLHKNAHFNVKMFVCELCGKRFGRRDTLVKHSRNFHENIKAFRCPICLKDFKGHLGQHVRTHSKQKPHTCPQCGSSFAQRSQLVVHGRVHSGERPFKCQICWKGFAHSTALKLHQRLHTGEKPFSCPICGSSFAQIPHFKKHMRAIHNLQKPFTCQWCQEVFSSKRSLEEHVELLHHPNKPEKHTPMGLSKMRLLLATLLAKISTKQRLVELGFNKRLIDDVLVTSIVYSGRLPCLDKGISEEMKLRNNIRILLDWTVPVEYMERFKLEQRSTEELLEELAS